MTSPVPHLADHARCTGCSACANGCPKGAIVMTADQEGFLYPHATESCVQCGHCAHICPALKQRELRPEPTVFAVWNDNPQQRSGSTAGGVFSALARFILESGGVVFGATADGNLHISHIAVQSLEELPRLMGAKLVQSEIGESYRQVRYFLDRERPVLFTGTPCQVDGLYRYLGESPDRLITADVVCHGVPSPGVWGRVVDTMSYIKQKRAISVSFCKKSAGSNVPRFCVRFEDGGSYDAPLLKSDYGRGLMRDLLLRPSCYQCPYAGTNRVADLTMGIFSGLPAAFLPEEQKKGVSLLMINTVKGAHIFDMLPLKREKRSLAEAVAGNGALKCPATVPAERAAFFAAYAHQPFQRVYQRFFVASDLSYRMANRDKGPLRWLHALRKEKHK